MMVIRHHHFVCLLLQVDVSALNLKANSDGQTVTVPLKGVRGSANATIKLTLAWLKSTRPMQQHRQKWQAESERILQQQPQQQQQGHSRSPSEQSLASLHHQQQKLQGHSRNQSNQSLSSLGLMSPTGPSAHSSASGATAGGGGQKAVSWPDQVWKAGVFVLPEYPQVHVWVTCCPQLHINT